MALLNKICRWVLSPLEMVPSPIVEDWQATAREHASTAEQLAIVADAASRIYPDYELPVCRQYCSHWEAPFHGRGFALVYCEFDITHLAAAQKDTRLVVFSSLDDALPAAAHDSYGQVVAPSAVKGLNSLSTPPVNLREMLARLQDRHVGFAAAE